MFLEYHLIPYLGRYFNQAACNTCTAETVKNDTKDSK